MNPLKGEVGFEAGGRARALVFDINAICALEAALDLGVHEIIDRFGAAPRVSLIRTLFWIGLQSRDPQITQAQAGDLMAEVGVAATARLVGEAFQKAFPPREDAKASGRPRTAAGPGTGPDASGSGAG